MANPTKFIALLRGINVGGKSKVDMAELRAAFETLGLKNVKTVLNSGNVIFESQNENLSDLQQLIEARLEQTFGRPIGVIIRSWVKLKQLVEGDPFKDVALSPETRLYVSFLAEPHLASLKTPYHVPGNEFSILKITNIEACWTLDVKAGFGTTEAMAILEKEFGKNITTRNWNTVCKLLV